MGWTHFLPVFMAVTFSLLSVVYSEVFFMLIGSYFTCMWYILWVIQYHIGQLRPDPYCAVYETYAYPSMEIFYAVALLTLVITYAFTAKTRPVTISVYAWCAVLLIGFAPPLLLYMYQMNTWQEVLSSVLIGIIPTFIFVLLLRYIVQPNVSYLLISPPFSWWGYESHFLEADPEQVDKAEHVRLLRLSVKKV